MANKPQYNISIISYRPATVAILLSGKVIKQFNSCSHSNLIGLERKAAAYCQKQGWGFTYAHGGVAYYDHGDTNNNEEHF